MCSKQTQRPLLISTLALILLFVSCAKKATSPETLNKSPIPQSESKAETKLPQSLEGPTWNILLKIKCDNRSSDQCLAGHGFSITSKGAFIVGPATENQTFTGRITSEELALLTDQITPLLPSLNTQVDNPQCITDISNHSEESLSLQYQDKNTDLIHISTREFCFHHLEKDKAQKFYSFVRKLTEQYYPIPFPHDTCSETLQSLKNIYNSVQKCTTNEECSFFQPDLTPISANELTFLAINECTSTKPLTVGNIQLVAEKRTEIQKLYDDSITACDQVSTTINCSGFSPFQPTLPRPICQSGICKAPDTL